MKTLNRIAFVSLSLALVVACKPAAPPKAGGGIATGAPSGPAPAPLLGHNLVYNGELLEGPAQPAVERRAVEAGGRAHVRRQGRAVPGGHEPRRSTAGTRSCATAHQAAEGAHLHDPVQGARDAEDARLPEAGSGRAAVTASSGSCCSPSRRSRRRSSATFTMDGAPTIRGRAGVPHGRQLAAQTPVPFTVCIDDVRLDDPQFTRRCPSRGRRRSRTCWSTRSATSRGSPKIATVKNRDDAADVGAAGRRAARRRHGHDSRSAPTPPRATACHVVDFSSYDEPGNGYTLRVGRRRQPPVRHRATTSTAS